MLNPPPPHTHTPKKNDFVLLVPAVSSLLPGVIFHEKQTFHSHVGLIVAYHPYLTAVVPIFVCLFIITNLHSHVIRAKPFDVGIDVYT